MQLDKIDKKALQVFTLTYGLNKDIKFTLLESLGSDSDSNKIAQQMTQLYNIKTMAETLMLSLPKINNMEHFPADYLRMNQLNAKAVKHLLSRGILKEVPLMLESDALDIDTTPEDFSSVVDEFDGLYSKYIFFIDYLSKRRTKYGK